MASSPFSRGDRCARSPPPTPVPTAAPRPVPAPASHPQTPNRSNEAMEVVSTPEIQNWMTTIDQCLGEVCTIASEGKLNSDQKMRISALCRSIGHGTSQLAVKYQSLKMKAVLANSTVKSLEDQLDLSQQLQELKMTVGASIKPNTGSSFADMDKSHL
ncbi:hypothetical protein PYW07_000279 [Mythimna separata]|uniref:Uncharacterized protein n=1 Tax=Mythimna separata TaxID=271217 RepID=A0AAD7Z3W8_MYTSE|nr:hypothetical protein PYW07_000279 [Mythimna separata]